METDINYIYVLGAFFLGAAVMYVVKSHGIKLLQNEITYLQETVTDAKSNYNQELLASSRLRKSAAVSDKVNSSLTARNLELMTHLSKARALLKEFVEATIPTKDLKERASNQLKDLDALYLEGR